MGTKWMSEVVVLDSRKSRILKRVRMEGRMEETLRGYTEMVLMTLSVGRPGRERTRLFAIKAVIVRDPSITGLLAIIFAAGP